MIELEITYKDLIDRLSPDRRVDQEAGCNHEVYVMSPNGFQKIIGTIEKSPGNVVRVEFEDGSAFECSENHLFSWLGEPVFANVAERVDTLHGELKVSSRRHIGVEPLFDICVPSPHWYVSDASNGVIHHNTYLTLGVVKHYLDEYPDALVCLFESESAISKDMLIARGIDVSRVAVFPCTTVEEFRDNTLRILTAHLEQSEKERPRLMFVLDSLGMLSTNKEIAEAIASSGTKDMTRAQLIKSAFRVLTLKLGYANIPLIVTNHVYANVGGNSPLPESGGGGGFKYAVSTEITLTKAKYKPKEGEDPHGIIVTATAKKSRLTVEGTKARVLIRYAGGLDKHYGLLPVAEAVGVVKKDMGRWLLPDGRKVFEKNIIDDPTMLYTDDVLKKIDEWCKENFTYGASSSNTIKDLSGETVETTKA